MIKVGLVLDVWGAHNGGPAKYSGITILMKRMKKDPRFDPYIITSPRLLGNSAEGRLNKQYLQGLEDEGFSFMDFDEANDPSKLDYFILTCPYRTLYRKCKIPYIYSEYGMDSISNDDTITSRYGGIYKNAFIILLSTDERIRQCRDKGIILPYMINKKPNYDYALDMDGYEAPAFRYRYNKVIMYAPHHTVDNTNTAADNCRWSTWEGFSDKFVNLVRSNPSWYFYYKPHPHLEDTCKKSIAYKKLLSFYKNVKIIEGDEPYYDYFNQSDLLITDCVSFIGEWMPTLKPLIRLYDSTSSKYSERAERIIRDCYDKLNVENSFDYIQDAVIAAEVDLPKLKEYLSEVALPGPQGNCGYILDNIYKIHNNLISRPF